jgi:hypothetical protein
MNITTFVLFGKYYPIVDQLGSKDSSRDFQQQQQHSLLSQASWGRLEMKPKRDEKPEDT